MAQFALSWNAYKQNICSGLSALQQNGEFVDMTLAADGCHVKVHQMVMSLVSPYIKEILTSAQCPHPVIFLNKMTHSTLSSILEYIYTGEVNVTKENLPAVVEAGKELRIKGLEDMNVGISLDTNQTQKTELQNIQRKFKKFPAQGASVDLSISKTYNDDRTDADETCADTDNDDKDTAALTTTQQQKPDPNNKDAQIQYTISNQGSIQMILNRFIYNLRYTSRRSDGHRSWRCVSAWHRGKCPAGVFTQGDIVVKRVHAHNHPFHDRRILGKVRDNTVFGAIHEAEARGGRKLRRPEPAPAPARTAARTADDDEHTDN